MYGLTWLFSAGRASVEVRESAGRASAGRVSVEVRESAGRVSAGRTSVEVRESSGRVPILLVSLMLSFEALISFGFEICSKSAGLSTGALIELCNDATSCGLRIVWEKFDETCDSTTLPNVKLFSVPIPPVPDAVFVEAI